MSRQLRLTNVTGELLFVGESSVTESHKAHFAVEYRKLRFSRRLDPSTCRSGLAHILHRNLLSKRYQGTGQNLVSLALRYQTGNLRRREYFDRTTYGLIYGSAVALTS